MAYCGLSEEEALCRVNETIETVNSEGHHVYRCIERGMFASARIQLHPEYQEVKKHFEEASFRLLELGCCFGTDARKMLHDGLDPQKLIVSDLHDFYWQVGQKVLFKDDLKNVEAVFLDFTGPRDKFIDTSGAKLEERFDVVSAMAILHVLSQDQCVRFLENAYACLKPNNGVLFGYCVGSSIPSEWGKTPTKGLQDRIEAPRFLHSQQSLTELLTSIQFREVQVSTVARGWSGAPPGPPKEPGAEMAYLYFTARR